MNKKIFVVGGDLEYANWFPFQKEFVDSVEKAELVVFTGGSDVDPGFYNENKHPKTYSDPKRDYNELLIFNKVKELKIPMIGICRGSQFLCIANDGKLVQHQQNPTFIHPMETYDDKVVFTTSTHHQAAYPFNLPEEDYKVLAWTEGISDIHEDGNEFELDPPVECEVVYYPKTQSLGIQGHPEMMFSNNKAEVGYEKDIEWFQNLLVKFLNKEL